MFFFFFFGFDSLSLSKRLDNGCFCLSYSSERERRFSLLIRWRGRKEEPNEFFCNSIGSRVFLNFFFSPPIASCLSHAFWTLWIGIEGIEPAFKMERTHLLCISLVLGKLYSSIISIFFFLLSCSVLDAFSCQIFFEVNF